MDEAITQFQLAAAYAAKFKLKLRMLCDRDSATSEHALGNKLVYLVRAIIVMWHDARSGTKAIFAKVLVR